MRTDELIDQLSTSPAPVHAGALQGRLLLAGGLGAALTLALVFFWLKIRPDLMIAAGGGFFWMRAGYTVALAAAGFWACERLARPDGRARRATWSGLAVLALFVALATIQFSTASPDSRHAMMMGSSWRICSGNILLLGLPILALTLLTLRRLAPTRPSFAGAAAGLFSGALAATFYGLHCQEVSAVFVAIWYSLGVALCTLAGALAGRWFLRW